MDALSSCRWHGHRLMSKGAKKRECPAVGRRISANECGENRQSRYPCPGECPYNPFAPALYSQFLELEGKLDQKCMARLVKDAPERAAIEKSLQQARRSSNPHAVHACYCWNLFFATDADGLTCCKRWEKAGFPELKNDERFLLRAKMQTRIGLLEIHRVLNGEQVEAVDLFSPDAPPLVLQDRSLARMAVRFAAALAWIYPLPHYWRLSGTVIVIPEMGQLEPVEIVTEIVHHLGGPHDVEAQRRWLAEHFLRFDDALHATSRLRRMRMFAGSDARFGKAVYELQAPFATCRARLDERPDVEPDDLSDAERREGFAEARVWFADDTQVQIAAPAVGRPVLGRVLLGQAHWRLEAMGGDRFAELRRKLETQLGLQIKFAGERLDDLGAGMAAKESGIDESLVPLRLVEGEQKIVIRLVPDSRAAIRSLQGTDRSGVDARH
jgi:hypothetical protein